MLYPVSAPAQAEKKELFGQITDKIFTGVREREEAGTTLLTIRQIRETFTAKWKEEVPGVSQEKVAAAANMAVAEGRLFLVKQKAPGGKTWAQYLSTAPDAEEEASIKGVPLRGPRPGMTPCAGRR